MANNKNADLSKTKVVNQCTNLPNSSHSTKSSQRSSTYSSNDADNSSTSQSAKSDQRSSSYPPNGVDNATQSAKSIQRSLSHQPNSADNLRAVTIDDAACIDSADTTITYASIAEAAAAYV